MTVGWEKKQFIVADSIGVLRPASLYHDRPLTYGDFITSSYGQRPEFQQFYFYGHDGSVIWVESDESFTTMLDRHRELTSNQRDFYLYAPFYRASSETPEPVDIFMIRKIVSGEDCCACLSEAPNIQFLPCGHVCCCTPCASWVVDEKQDCPVCRGKILSVCFV